MSLVPALQVEVPLVGRQAERDQLIGEVTRAQEGITRCLVVGGEAGIGKTRLVRELAGIAEPETRVVWGQCVELGANGLPYAPFVSVLRSLVSAIGLEAVSTALGPGRAELARLLPELGAAAPESDLGRGRLFEAVAALIERAAGQHPLVVVIEDVHWSDPSTRALLGFLVRSLVDTRVLIVLTYRTDEMHRTHPLRPFLAELERSPRASRLTVPRLRPANIATILTHVRGTPPSAALLADVVTRSDGVPFFVEELAECQPGDDLPDSLRELLLVRVEALSEPARRVLRVAAVGGLHVSHQALAAVVDLPVPELDQALREAVADHQLVVDRAHHGYAFRHALVREAVHDDLLPGEHGSLHEQWARALEQRSREESGESLAVQISHHWYAALDLERAFASALRAADETRAMYAPREEMQMLDRVLELWSRVSDAETQAGMDRVDVLVLAGEAAWRAGEPDRSESFADAAVRAVDSQVDPVRHAHLLIKRATFGVDSTDSDTVQMLTDALALLPADVPSQDRACALAKLAGWYVLRNQWDEAADLATQARDVARGIGDPENESDAVNSLALAYAGMGEFERSRGLFEEARRLAEQAGSEQALGRYRGNLGDLLLSTGDFSGARQVSHEGREHALRRGLVRSAATFLAGNEAEALIALGEWDQALALVEQALGQDPPRPSFTHLSCQRATVLLLRGAPGARDVVDELARVPRWFPRQPQFVIPAAQLQAEQALSDNEPAEALRLVVEAMERSGPRAHASAAWQLLHTMARTIGQLERAGKPTDDARTRLASARSSFTASGTQVMWDAVIDAELAHQHGSRAVQAWSAAVGELHRPGVQGPVYLRGYARYRLGGALLVDGRREEARDVLAAALEQADALDAKPLRDGVSSLARRARLQLTERRAEAVPAEPTEFKLTPREREVLALVAEGRSNAQIAERLFISTKTASVHVSNIMAKMGAESRGEAAAVAHARGLVEVSARGSSDP